MMSAYLTATRYALIEQLRNRVAFGLLLIFLPLWDFADRWHGAQRPRIV